jgi:hypothetical protein
MISQPYNTQLIPGGKTELFGWGYLDQCQALLLRVEVGNWLWWLGAQQVSIRNTAQGS